MSGNPAGKPMTNPVLVLKSGQSDSWWYESREVSYPKLMSYDFLDEIAGNLPAPAVGLYVDRHKDGRLQALGHLAPALLRVTGIRKDAVGRPHIRVECVSRLSGVKSSDLDRFLGSDRWITAVSRDTWDQARQALGISPPREWSHLLEISEAAPTVREFLGPHYLRLLDEKVDYPTVRAVVSDALCAMGYDVTDTTRPEQRETSPDGFACTPAGERFAHWFVYNCKSEPFQLVQESVFFTKTYIAKYQRDLPGQKAVPAAAARFLFIAPAFDNAPECERNLVEIERVARARGCLLTFDALLLLLVKKLRLGYRLTFADFDRLFHSANVVTASVVEAAIPG
ncbi:hypothetical protein JXB37_07675 [candidate division WOR-3 bacterium]|nr:hypothetical protein [candidate division WOR-3 bacterium]